MPCSRKEALARLFSNLCTTLKFIFLFFYLFYLFFAKLLTFFCRSDDEYDDSILYEDEEDEEEQEEEEIVGEEDLKEQEFRYSHVERYDHLIADIVNEGEDLVFISKDYEPKQNSILHVHSDSYESIFEDPPESFDDVEEIFYVEDYCSSLCSEDDHSCEDVVEYEVVEAEYTTPPPETRPSEEKCDKGSENKNCISDGEDDSFHSFKCQSHRWQNHQLIDEEISQKFPTSFVVEDYSPGLNDDNNTGESDEKEIQVVKEETNFIKDEKFLIFDPPKSETRKLQALDKEKDQMFEDTYTIGSTSKSSSEWRSSIRDSGTELDPFSSSSRRSCPKWESYTVYQKYDEEMMYLDRISAQKLHETESLRSFQVAPRSISERIVHKLATKQKTSNQVYKNTYNELEAAYVGQICLAWEALNWNYANFQHKQVSRKEQDLGCPAYIAQQFQQFQVLLQWYIETEPYERGRRPEIYARMRTASPKLLQVPEYHEDYEGKEKEETSEARITSDAFLAILEDAIRTFKNFLKADRRTQCQVLNDLFKRRPRKSVDATVLNVVKKHNKKMKVKVKELQGSCICFKRKKMTREEEMELVMSLIDLRLVSRVLRMADLTREQLQWCVDKMSKLRLFDGKLHRDSSPLFFPAQ